MFDVPSAFGPVGCRNTHEQRADPFHSHIFYNLEQRPDAIFERAAETILPFVTERRKEFVQQITVGRVNLDHIEPRLARTEGGHPKIPQHFIDSRVERSGRRVIRGEG